MSYGAVDVNVHPTKTEVKFADENGVFHSVYDCVLSALGRETPGLDVGVSKSTERLFEKAAPQPETQNGAHAPRNYGGDRLSRPQIPLYSEKRSSDYGILRDVAPSLRESEMLSAPGCRGLLRPPPMGVTKRSPGRRRHLFRPGWTPACRRSRWWWTVFRRCLSE